MWQSTYTIDVIILAIYLYTWQLHLVWLKEINEGFNLEPNPNASKMYI